MIRADRPFDRWFDLSDAYDDVVPHRRPAAPRPDADREWTYEAPRPAKPAAPPPADDRTVPSRAF